MHVSTAPLHSWFQCMTSDLRPHTWMTSILNLILHEELTCPSYNDLNVLNRTATSELCTIEPHALTLEVLIPHSSCRRYPPTTTTTYQTVTSLLTLAIPGKSLPHAGRLIQRHLQQSAFEQAQLTTLNDLATTHTHRNTPHTCTFMHTQANIHSVTKWALLSLIFIIC